jgi:conjugative transfer signal peptidase TraF
MSPDLHRFQPQGLSVGLAVAAAATAAALLCVSRPWVLINTTPSEPEGLYLGQSGEPIVGALAAFRAPAAAFPYADARLSYLRHRPLLKAIAAASGDTVCTTSGRLVINGQDRAPITRLDGQGRALPVWMGCRPMAVDEVFAFSDRVPNSFDSRYFGPVRRSAVLGVYRPLITVRETP